MSDIQNERLIEFISNSKVAFINGQFQEAFTLAKEAIKLDENCADAYQCAANVCMSLGRYSMVMHLVFNAVNVAVSYAGMIMIPGWFLIGAFVVGVIGFIVLCIFFFKKNPVELQVSGYKGRQLVTKEGYITMAVCLCVTGMLLMI